MAVGPEDYFGLESQAGLTSAGFGLAQDFQHWIPAPRRHPDESVRVIVAGETQVGLKSVAYLPHLGLEKYYVIYSMYMNNKVLQNTVSSGTLGALYERLQ
jgi:hypothetical protein